MILGLIGAVVPGMPTTVFILMAAWAAVRSSPRLHRWLYAHRVFGPLLHNWDTGGKVSRRAKWTATVSMGASSLLILYFSYKPWLTAMTLSIMACVLLWLWPPARRALAWPCCTPRANAMKTLKPAPAHGM